jgi:hypothetical protein
MCTQIRCAVHILTWSTHDMQALVDEIIAKIMEEEKQEALAKMAKRRETIEYIQRYLKENEELKEQEKRRQEEEDLAIQKCVLCMYLCVYVCDVLCV